MQKRTLLALVALVGLLSTTAQAYPLGSSFEQEADMLYEPTTIEVRDVGEQEDVSRGQELLNKLGERLNANETTLDRVETSINHAEAKAHNKAKEVATLKGQLARLEREVERSEQKVIAVREQITLVQDNLSQLFEEIEIQGVEVEAQKQIVQAYIEMLYINTNSYESEDSTAGTLKLLLATENVSDSLKDTTYLTLLNDQGRELFEILVSLSETYDRKKDAYNAHHAELNKLNDTLTAQMMMMREQRAAKDKLLEETQGEEELYRQLLLYAHLEQEHITEEIKKLQKNIAYINDKIDTLGDEELDKIEKNINEEGKRSYLLSLNAGDVGNLPQFSWPLYPAKGISAYFKDSGYKQFFGIPHYAIDIPAPQGSPVRSIAPGIVTKVVERDDSGYNYVIIAHKDGFASLYGHMYGIEVKEQDILHRGDIIGISGGVPGTRGAGLLTTGAHLHLELFKSGVQIDPLMFLPLKNLPLQYLQNLPKKYIELLEAEKNGDIKQEKDES